MLETVIPCHMPDETGVQLVCAMTYSAETRTLTKQAQNKLAEAHTKMERSMLNITYKDVNPKWPVNPNGQGCLGSHSIIKYSRSIPAGLNVCAL